MRNTIFKGGVWNQPYESNIVNQPGRYCKEGQVHRPFYTQNWLCVCVCRCVCTLHARIWVCESISMLEYAFVCLEIEAHIRSIWLMGRVTDCEYQITSESPKTYNRALQQTDDAPSPVLEHGSGPPNSSLYHMCVLVCRREFIALIPPAVELQTIWLFHITAAFDSLWWQKLQLVLEKEKTW